MTFKMSKMCGYYIINFSFEERKAKTVIMIDKNVVDLETAILAEEKGFNISTPRHWVKFNKEISDTDIFGNKIVLYKKDKWYLIPNSFFAYTKEVYRAPTKDELAEWLRDQKIHISLFPKEDWDQWGYHVYTEGYINAVTLKYHSNKIYQTHDEAYVAALHYALNWIKKANNNIDTINPPY